MNLEYKRNILRLGVATFVIAFATWAHAQNATSCAITGTVTDSTGAVVPGVQVTVTNQATGITQKTVTNNTGFYTEESIVAGDYSATAQKSGFKMQTIKNIHLDPGQRRGLDLVLTIGETTSTVTVEAEAVAVQTESSESGGTISSKEVANLMLNGRNFQTLSLIVPGASSVTEGNATSQYGFGGYLGQTTVVVGGSSVEKTAYMIDGVYDNEPSGLLNVNVTPEIDAISEFRILKDNFSAKYGTAGSGQILVETKMGSNIYHGTTYEYLRNSSVGAARTYLSTSKVTPLHYHIYGYSLGGPVQIPHLFDGKDRTFFFAAGEWRVNHHYDGTHTRLMFYQAMRNGDFSQSPTLPSSGLKLDSSSQALLTNAGKNPSTCITADSSGLMTQISTSCMDTTAVALMNEYWPLPNAIVSTNLASVNYTNNTTDSDNQLDQTYRIDHKINDKNTLTGRWMFEETSDFRPRNYNDPATYPMSTIWSRGLNAMLRLSTILTPNLINSAQVAETYAKYRLGVSHYTMPSGSSIAQAFSGADPYDRIPNIQMSGTWSWLGVGAQPNWNDVGEGIIADDLSWLKGNHVLQFGADYFFGIRRYNSSSAFTQGLFTFTGTHTGDAAADYLLGLDSAYTQYNAQRSGIFHNRWGEAYMQDDWKAARRLTINIGIRFSMYAPTTMSGAKVTNFDASTFNASEAPVISTSGYETLNSLNEALTASGTVASTTNGLVYSGVSGTPYGFEDNKYYFGPRIGFAYKLTSDGKTSLHAGYGLAYTRVGYEQIASLINNPPYASSTTVNNGLLSQPTIGAAGAPPIPSLTVIGPNVRATGTNTFSLTLEREVIPNGILSVAYAGSTTRHITLASYDYNFAQNGTSTNTATCAASTSNPLNSSSPYGTYAGPAVTSYQFDPCLNTGSVSSLYYRPYSGYSSISGTYSGGAANYNAFQSAFVYRRSDLQLNLAYTFAKSLSDVIPANPGSNGAGVGYDDAATPQNMRNIHDEYGRPDYDRPHVFTAAWVYELPALQHTNRLLIREILNGWDFSGLSVLESGFAITPSLGTSNTGLATRPNLIAPIRRLGSGKVSLGDKLFVDPSSFQPPAFGMFGDAKTGDIRGPRDITFNVALDKDLPINERLSFKLRAEAFNIFNHPNTIINSTWSGTSGGTFGQVTGANDPRQMEFSARFTF